jgi:hypothetical protein
VEGREPPFDLLGSHREVRAQPVRSLRTTAVAVVAALGVLASCSTPDDLEGAGGRPASKPSPSSAGSQAGHDTTAPVPEDGASSAPGAPDIPRRPRVNACYKLGFDEATEPTNDDPRVSCRKRHTAQTYYVGRLDTVVDGHLLAVDSRLAQRQVERTCPRELVDYLGGTAEDRSLSRIEAVWFSPTIEQSDRGASWFRCDAVALGKTSTLAPLPPPGRLEGILDRPGALDEVGLCGTTAPGARGFERVICSRRHAWKALSTIQISGGNDYPGVAEVREAGESACRDLVARASGSPERFTYGWEWPTRAQWRDGQRFGYCWAPD